MNKPTPQTVKSTHYDYIECRDFLEKKYDYRERDFAGHFHHHEAYEKATGDKRPAFAGATAKIGGYYKYNLLCDKYNPDQIKSWNIGGKECSEEEALIHARLYVEWEKRFREWEVINPRPEYQDFWHWICDSFEIHNGCYISFNKDSFDDAYFQKTTPEFAKTIYKYYVDEFADKTGELKMWVEW